MTTLNLSDSEREHARESGAWIPGGLPESYDYSRLVVMASVYKDFLRDGPRDLIYNAFHLGEDELSERKLSSFPQASEYNTYAMKVLPLSVLLRARIPEPELT